MLAKFIYIFMSPNRVRQPIFHSRPFDMQQFNTMIVYEAFAWNSILLTRFILHYRLQDTLYHSVRNVDQSIA